MDQIKAAELEARLKKEHGNIAGVVVLKNGETVYQNYFNSCGAASRVHVYSVTKSIVSILIGIALDQGYIQSVDQKVLEFFPEYAVKKGEETIRSITLRDMLTMTAPYKYRFAPYIKYFTSEDWVRFSLDLLGGKGRIGTFRYAPLIGPDILTGILARATGRSVLDFAAEHLFRPLDITVESSVVFHSMQEQLAFNKATDISGWVADAKGVNAAGWGLTLSAMDMAKLGQLYLNGGTWAGRQLVSADWVAESTRQHSRWEKENLSYGYLWWLADADGQACAAMGDGGNVIYFNRQTNMVIAIASLFKPRVNDRIELIKGYIEPLLETAGR